MSFSRCQFLLVTLVVLWQLRQSGCNSSSNVQGYAELPAVIPERHPLGLEVDSSSGFLQPVVPKYCVVRLCIGDDHPDANNLRSKLNLHFSNFSQRCASLSVRDDQGGAGSFVDLPSKSVQEMLRNDANSSSCIYDS